MEYFNNIIETIGNTPLVRLNNVMETDALVLAKVETFNPGHSIKDRMALKMIEDAGGQISQLIDVDNTRKIFIATSKNSKLNN